MRQPKDHPWRKQIKSDRRSDGTFAPENKMQKRREIPAAKVREAFEKSGLSKCELARRMGWSKRIPNVHFVNETLGYYKRPSGKPHAKLTYQMAVRLARAMDADLVELGV